MLKSISCAAGRAAVVCAVFGIVMGGAGAAPDSQSTPDKGNAASALVVKNDAPGWMWYGMDPYENAALPDGAAHVGGPGTYAMYTFQGSGVDVYGVRALSVVADKRTHRVGKLKISIDDKEQATIDLGAATADYHAKIFSITGLSGGNHVLQLDPVGGWAVVDSLTINSASGEGASLDASPANLVGKDHLMGYWAFEEGDGATVADKSGHGHDGSFQAGAVWTKDSKVGKGGVSFPQPGGVEISGPVVDTSKSYTIAAWVKFSPTTDFQTFVSIDGADQSGFYLQWRGDRMAFTQHPLHADATAPFAAGQWRHIAGVYDAPTHTIAIFVDGKLEGTEQVPPSPRTTGNLVIGRAKFSGNYTDFVTGQIDDVRLYDIALLPTDIAALYIANK